MKYFFYKGTPCSTNSSLGVFRTLHIQRSSYKGRDKTATDELTEVSVDLYVTVLLIDLSYLYVGNVKSVCKGINNRLNIKTLVYVA